MADALIDVTIPDLTNEQVDQAVAQVKSLLEGRFPDVEVELNPHTEYDDEAEANDED